MFSLAEMMVFAVVAIAGIVALVSLSSGAIVILSPRRTPTCGSHDFMLQRSIGRPMCTVTAAHGKPRCHSQGRDIAHLRRIDGLHP